MRSSNKTGILLAIAAAALYAINSPFSKLLLEVIPSTLMAGFLYLGAGVGMVIIALALMIVGAWLCSKDEPVFKKTKKR